MRLRAKKIFISLQDIGTKKDSFIKSSQILIILNPKVLCKHLVERKILGLVLLIACS